jgi:hypothetical protein
MLDACLAERSRLRRDVPEENRKELLFLIPKMDTLLVPEELHEFPGRHEPSRSISVRGGTAQPHCLHKSLVMVARERDQGGVALHSPTLECTLAAEELQDATVAAFEETLTTGHPDAASRSGRDPHEPGLRQARAAPRGGDPKSDTLREIQDKVAGNRCGRLEMVECPGCSKPYRLPPCRSS